MKEHCVPTQLNLAITSAADVTSKYTGICISYQCDMHAITVTPETPLLQLQMRLQRNNTAIAVEHNVISTGCILTSNRRW